MTKQENLPKSVKSLILCNRLIVKAFNASDKKKLEFVILNETKHVVSYDRAFLWDLSDESPSIVGISGLSAIDETTEFLMSWKTITKNIPDKSAPLKIDETTVPNCSNELRIVKGSDQSVFYWLPIASSNSLLMGLVLTFPPSKVNSNEINEEIDIFNNFLMPGYASGLEKFAKKTLKVGKKNTRLIVLASVFLFLLFASFFKVPLRIVSSCEVVSREPMLVTAPLEGVIKEIKVLPGDKVSFGDLLVEYEKSAFLQDLQLAQKELELRNVEVSRSKTLGYDDEEKLSELRVLMAKNDQAKAFAFAY